MVHHTSHIPSLKLHLVFNKKIVTEDTSNFITAQVQIVIQHYFYMRPSLTSLLLYIQIIICHLSSYEIYGRLFCVAIDLPFIFNKNKHYFTRNTNFSIHDMVFCRRFNSIVLNRTLCREQQHLACIFLLLSLPFARRSQMVISDLASNNVKVI